MEIKISLRAIRRQRKYLTYKRRKTQHIRETNRKFEKSLYFLDQLLKDDAHVCATRN